MLSQELAVGRVGEGGTDHFPVFSLQSLILLTGGTPWIAPCRIRKHSCELPAPSAQHNPNALGAPTYMSTSHDGAVDKLASVEHSSQHPHSSPEPYSGSSTAFKWEPKI